MEIEIFDCTIEMKHFSDSTQQFHCLIIWDLIAFSVHKKKIASQKAHKSMKVDIIEGFFPVVWEQLFVLDYLCLIINTFWVHGLSSI